MMTRHDQFFSRRNQVVLHSESLQHTVKKIFRSWESYKTERDFYLSLQSMDPLNVPRLIAHDDQRKLLLLEHIEGQLLTDMLEDCERSDDLDKACTWIRKTVEWLTGFHDLPQVREKRWTIHDINLRNFIISREEVFGIDFEQLREGSKETDIIRLIAMYLYEDPIESDFKVKVIETLKSEFLELLNMDNENFSRILEIQIEIIQERRQKKQSKAESSVNKSHNKRIQLNS